MARDVYEISIWEDKLITNDGPEHFEEQKVAVIGSNTMTAACRAYEPRLVENINGTNTFTFKMYYVYTDEQTGEKLTNPFLALLVNERKIKVKWKSERDSGDPKWYDLVVKNIQEDSSGKSITYTCKDQFINELSKNGFNLEFSDELENSQGTIIELGERILEGTEWQIDEAGSDIIQQEIEEPVYVGITNQQIIATNETDGGTITIPSGKTILIFYSCVQNRSSKIQFLYDSSQTWPRDINSQLVINVPCCSYNVVWSDNKPTILFSLGSTPSNEYRGSRLVSSQKTILDPLTDKYVKIYKPNQSGDGYNSTDEIYGYTTTEYRDATFVNNLIVNSKDFASTTGWIGTGLTFNLYPPYTSTSDLDTYSPSSYMYIGGEAGKTKRIFNTGLSESSSYIPNGIQKGEKYIFRFKALYGDANSPTEDDYVTQGIITPSISKYNDNKVPTGNNYISFGSGVSTSDHWVEYECTCVTSFSRSDTYQHLGFFFTLTPGEISKQVWIQEIQFFPYTIGEVHITEEQFNTNKTLYYTRNNNGTYIKCTNASNYDSTTTYYKRINPGEMDQDSVAQEYYYYYNHTTSAGTNPDNLKYLHVGTEPWTDDGKIAPVYNDNFVKIRSINAKQSNRFNLLQTLAETFECWCQFEIKHDIQGKIIYNNGVPQKFVRFKKEIGQETHIGFIYGLDLKAISRTIQSDQIVTKTIVSPNSNEFGKDGFCTIARSENNITRDTFILNFDYYLSQGLLSSSELNKDLYSQFNDNINQGYYAQLRELNKEFDSLTDLLIEKRMELTKQESYKTVYDGYITSLQQEQQDLQNTIKQLANVTNWKDALSFINKQPKMTEILTRMNALANCENNLKSYKNMSKGISNSIRRLDATIKSKEKRQENIIEQLKTLNYAFYRKYAHYIQEGSWIDESYIDDDLYYLDAQSVAYTSSRPQVSYDISVARISAIEEFKNKVFRLGDISFIQDTEFFGYVIDENGVKTPYKEKVLISEITSNFDSPQQDTFKVQNYKTQFEDLFQRITATTQSLQFASGEYAKVAQIIEPTGVIKTQTLQDSIAFNNNLVIQSNNEQVFQDSTGITVTDATNPNKKTKITSGGVFISTDGGTNWKNAIRGEGIATQYLTAGSINTNEITLMDGEHQAFRWDSNGINAYDKLANGEGVNLNKAVRFDHFGIYGINITDGSADGFIPSTEKEIWDTAKFGMTWQGFFIKNDYGDHYVEVSSTKDIQIVDTKGTDVDTDDIVRVKIGKLENNVYGLRLKDAAGTTTLETVVDGTLWLKDALHIGTSPDGGYYASIGYLPKKQSNKIIWENTDHSTISLDDRKYNSGANSYIRRILDLNNKFVVWEDGTVYAKDGYFKGDIYAEDGYFAGELNGATGTFAGNISAATGTIGGWIIKSGELESQGIIAGQTQPAKVVLDGANGKLIINSTAGFYNIALGYLDLVSSDNQVYWDNTPTGRINLDARTTNTGDIIHRTFDINNKFVVWEDGTLYARDGYFKGTIYATDAYLEGEIHAASGTIGGWIIGTDELYSYKTKYIPTQDESPVNDKVYYQKQSESEYIIANLPTDEQGNRYFEPNVIYYEALPLSPENAKIRLKGSEGAIYAYDLTLGDAATIENFMQLGTGENAVYLYNPDYALSEESLAYFYKVNNNVYLTADGTFQLNGIVLDGVTTTIKGTRAERLDDANYGWPDFYIRPDKAYFPNVDVSGKISAAVFEKGHVQVVGGSMLFKPAFKIERFKVISDGNKTALLINEPLEEGILDIEKQYVCIVDSTGAPTSVGDITNVQVIEINKPPQYVDYTSFEEDNVTEIVIPLILPEKKGTEKITYQTLVILGEDDDIIIGVNSTNDALAWLKPRGLTISTFNHSYLDPAPRVYLGDLSRSNLNITGIDITNLKYGLFSDNVILQGSIVTHITEPETSINTYAGINTLTGAQATIFESYFEDTSSIIMWAGAKNVNSEAIQAAPFQVTSQGSIYAQNGLFEGVIISRSSITGVDIYAARIHGVAKDRDTVGNENNEYGLAFYDCAEGIVFKTGGQDDDDTDVKEVFSIGSNGLKTASDYYFISISNNNVDFYGRNYTATSTMTSSYIVATTQLVQRYDNNSILIGGSGDIQKTRITYWKDSAYIQSYIDLEEKNSHAMIFSTGNAPDSDSVVSLTLNSNLNLARFSTGSFWLGTKMEYRYHTDHYDLYVN